MLAEHGEDLCDIGERELNTGWVGGGWGVGGGGHSSPKCGSTRRRALRFMTGPRAAHIARTHLPGSLLPPATFRGLVRIRSRSEEAPRRRHGAGPELPKGTRASGRERGFVAPAPRRQCVQAVSCVFWLLGLWVLPAGAPPSAYCLYCYWIRHRLVSRQSSELTHESSRRR
jgi:hypothetical protein